MQKKIGGHHINFIEILPYMGPDDEPNQEFR